MNEKTNKQTNRNTGYFLITRQNSPAAAGKHWPACKTYPEHVDFFLAGAECNSARVDMDQQRLPTESLREEL